MKAIVAEIDKKQMIVITDKGDFIKVKRQMSVGIGDEIELKPQKINLTYRRLASIAACFLMCIFLSTGVYAYYTPYSYVSVDINPSIALSLNRFERIIEVNPLNEDAVSLLKDAKGLKNQDINDALSTIIKSASEKGYIDTESENQVMVVVSAKDQQQEKELEEAVTIAAAKELAKVNKNSDIMVEKATVESYKEAVAHKVSPGKEILAGKLREVMPEIKDEEVMEMSVKEVVHLINEGRKSIKTAEKKDDKEDSKNKEEGKDKDKDKEAAKADAKAEKDDKGKDKYKPAAAASKDDKGGNGSDKEKPAALSKDNEGKPGKGDNDKATQDDDDKNKDDDDDDKKKENNKGKDKSDGGLGGKDGKGDGDGQEKDDDGSKDSRGHGDRDKEKEDGKKGN